MKVHTDYCFRVCQRFWAVFLFLSFSILCLTGNDDVLAGDDAQYKSFPVPIRIDFGECVESSFYVKCKCLEHKTSYPEFVSAYSSNAEESSLQQVISSIRNKNLSGSLDLCSPAGGLENQKKSEYEQKIGVLTDAFADGVLAKLDVVRVDAKCLLGNRILFIWGLNKTPQGVPAFRSWMIFERSAANEILWKPQISRLDNYSMLLVSIMERRARTGKEFKSVENRQFQYEFAIPGTSATEPAYVQFNGKVYDFELFEDLADPNDEIMKFYQNTFNVLETGNPNDLAVFYTEKSCANYLKWLTGKYSDYANWYHDNILQRGRKVLFILDADPFYFVFHKEIRSKNRIISFDEIVRDPSDNKLKLTNFHYNDYIHSYLKDRNIFVEPILKSLIKKNE